MGQCFQLLTFKNKFKNTQSIHILSFFHIQTFLRPVHIPVYAATPETITYKNKGINLP